MNMTAQITTAILILSILILTLTGCSDESRQTIQNSGTNAPSQAPVSSNPPADHPVIQQAAEQSLTNEGKVLTVEQTPNYTYLEVQALANGLGYWLATTHLDVKPGDNVRWGKFTIMKNFESKALGRVFKQVLFVNSIEKAVAGQPSQISSNTKSGKVVSAQPSAGYVYLEVETSSGTQWLAAPESPVQAGNNISWSSGSTMRNFNSKSLDRTFDEIIFVGGVNVVD